MWPFDLRGPEFLVFYRILGALVIVAVVLLRHSAEPSGPKISFTDPCLVAFLRGGKHETLRVATMSLIDRGILKAEGSAIAPRTERSAGGRNWRRAFYRAWIRSA